MTDRQTESRKQTEKNRKLENEKDRNRSFNERNKMQEEESQFLT